MDNLDLDPGRLPEALDGVRGYPRTLWETNQRTRSGPRTDRTWHLETSDPTVVVWGGAEVYRRFHRQRARRVSRATSLCLEILRSIPLDGTIASYLTSRPDDVSEGYLILDLYEILDPQIPRSVDGGIETSPAIA